VSEGTELLILTQPPDRPRTNAAGERAAAAVTDRAWDAGFRGRNPRNATEWRVRAIRRDRGGREAIFGDARGGRWSTRFEIRRTPALEALDETWSMRGLLGERYDIEAVDAAAARGDIKWWIYAERKGASRAG